MVTKMWKNWSLYIGIKKSEMRKAPRELEALRKEGLTKAPTQAEERCEHAERHQESISMRLTRNRKLIDEREV